MAPRGPSEAPTDYAERAGHELPGAAAEIESIVRAYLRVRYEPGAGPAELEQLRRAVREFKPA